MTTTSPSKTSDRLAFFPRLTRFYGMSFTELSALPRAILKLYLDAMPALEAEEQLSAIQASSFAYSEQADQKRLHRILIRMAESGPEDQVAEPIDTDPTRRERTLGSMGIKVVT